jgi:hypothetical protein
MVTGVPLMSIVLPLMMFHRRCAIQADLTAGQVSLRYICEKRITQ